MRAKLLEAILGAVKGKEKNCKCLTCEGMSLINNLAKEKAEKVTDKDIYHLAAGLTEMEGNSIAMINLKGLMKEKETDLRSVLGEYIQAKILVEAIALRAIRK
jgi:hypothetical protein